MSFALWLYPKWVRLSKAINNWLEAAYVEYHNAKNLAEAEEFLRKFRESGNESFAQAKARDRKPDPNCKHLKGGSSIRVGYKDYNVACHNFPDGTAKIWCLNGCGFVSWKGSKSWPSAIKLMERTTNTQTSSEIIWKKDATNVRRP